MRRQTLPNFGKLRVDLQVVPLVAQEAPDTQALEQQQEGEEQQEDTLIPVPAG